MPRRPLPRCGISLPGSYVNLLNTELSFLLDECVAIGATSVRVGFTPGAQAQGVYAVGQIEARGLAPLVIIGDQIKPGQWTVDDYASFTTYTVTGFPNVRLFECGNEFNLLGGTPTEYAALSNAGRAAARKVRKSVVWLAGATGIGNSAQDQYHQFVAPLLPLIAGKVDVWSYHDGGDPYDQSWYRGAYWAHNEVRRQLDAQGDWMVPIVCSEYDQWTANLGVDLGAALTDPRTPAVWVYAMQAEPTLAGFGLLDGTTRTPAWDAYRAVA